MYQDKAATKQLLYVHYTVCVDSKQRTKCATTATAYRQKEYRHYKDEGIACCCGSSGVPPLEPLFETAE